MKITVVSLNLWHGQLLHSAVDWLRGQDADILLLQEVYNGSELGLAERFRTMSVLRERLGYEADDFAAAGRERRAEGRISFGNAVFARFPLTPREPIFFDTPYSDNYVSEPKNYAHSPRVIQHVMLQMPAGELDLLNVHGPWDLTGERNSPARRKMAAAIVRAARGRELVVVAGDTNAKPVNECWQPVDAELQNVFGNELKSTFNMEHKTNPGYATAAVDMMFVSRDVSVLERGCPDVDVSDHLPLVVKLEL